MRKSKVIMVCKEIWRATVVVEHNEGESQEVIKDEAWLQFDDKMVKDLEQENFTKVEAIEHNANEANEVLDENVMPPIFDETK